MTTPTTAIVSALPTIHCTEGSVFAMSLHLTERHGAHDKDLLKAINSLVSNEPDIGNEFAHMAQQVRSGKLSPADLGISIARAANTKLARLEAEKAIRSKKIADIDATVKAVSAAMKTLQEFLLD